MTNSKNSQVVLEQECRLAEHCFTRGEVARALPHYRRALLVDPDSHKWQLRVGQCLDRLGETGEAYDTFRRILVRGIARCEEPIRREILQAITNLCHRIDKEIEVIEYLTAHQPLIEDTPALFYNLGLAYFKCRRYPEARECFDRLKAIHPKNSAGYIGQAVLFCHFNQLGNAVQELMAARHAVPNDVQITENLAVVQMKMGNPLGAVTTLRSALSRGGAAHNAKLYHLLGMAHLRLGELVRAEQYLRKSLELERTSDGLREMGWLFVARGNYTDSIAYLKEALAINPNDIWAKVDLAIAYFKQGVTVDAQILFNEARAASPTPEVSKLLDDLARVIDTGPRP